MRINEDFLDDAQRDDIPLTTADVETPEYGGSYDIVIYIDLQNTTKNKNVIANQVMKILNMAPAVEAVERLEVIYNPKDNFDHIQTSDHEYKPEVALEKLSMLEEDWDGYGSPVISRKAISNCHLIISQLSNLSASAIEVLPTEYGGVQIKKQQSDGRFISCDFGDNSMSYYIEKDGKPEYFPFLSYSETNVQELAEILR